MIGKQRFYICGSCGNMIGFINDKGVPLKCCGQNMTEIVPNTVEAATEKHIPDVTVNGNELDVKVGTTAHPMEEAHHISFIYVETEKGGQRKELKIGAEPVSKFSFIDDKPLAAYAYCNLHGLWKTEV